MSNIDRSEEQSIHDFWSDIAKQSIDWIRPWEIAAEGSFKEGNIRWFTGGLLNVAANCLDKHLPQKANHTAILWEGNEEGDTRSLSFAQLQEEVCRMANVLKGFGIKKGDVVGIYLPMIPEAAIAMLACARIGAIHTVVFAGFSAESLKKRLIDSNCKCLITANAYNRGKNLVLLKEQADLACATLNIQKLLIKNHPTEVAFDEKKENWWHELRQDAPIFCEPEVMAAEDPLFILYTSGSTGQPKGLVHTSGGYLVQVAYTHQLIFNCQKDDVFWCTADVGWITGHSYVLYGPLCNGVTTLMYEGVPNWPDAGRIWRIIDRHQVSVFYTAPTALRSLMRAGDEWLKGSKRDSLRLLGSVGEPLNPEAWLWYFKTVGQGLCPIMDTWWQTETGAVLIYPKDTASSKAGSAGKPIPGIAAVLLDAEDKELKGAANGQLAIKYPWPSIARTILNDHARYCKTYFSKGYYISQDGAKRDEAGDYWITGRMDDVLNVSGHRLGTAEIESALVSHPAVAEAGVVGVPHEVKGQGIYAFVTLKDGFSIESSALTQHVKEVLSPIAKPDAIRFLSDLPKTRSGKIMRRILRKVACKEVQSKEELGDLTTLANPQIIDELLGD